MMEKLTLKSLPELDGGRVMSGFDRELAACVKDVIDRPLEKGARKVTLTLTLKPIVEDGHASVGNMEFEIVSKIPKRRSRTHEVALHAAGSIGFNPVSPDNVYQGTLDELTKPPHHPPKPTTEK